MFKTPLLCDRRVYDKRGKWKSPNNDFYENVFYFVKDPLTLVPSFENYGREQLKESITITIFGGKPIAKEDTIVLEDNHIFNAEAVEPVLAVRCVALIREIYGIS